MWFLYVFAVVAGGLNALQSGANATLSKVLGQPVVAALVILTTSATGLLAAGLVSGQLAWPEPGKWGQVPWWAWIGGIFGAIFIMAQLLVAQRVGAGPFMGLVVTAAVTVSVALDHFGLMGFERHAASPWRIVGTGLMVAGLALIARF